MRQLWHVKRTFLDQALEALEFSVTYVIVNASPKMLHYLVEF